MDVVSHGLWSGAIYNRSRHIWRALFFGTAPDVFSFGVLTVTYLFANGLSRPEYAHSEPPDPSLVPQYVHGLYNVTHSLVIFLIAFVGVSWLAKRMFWEMTAWGLHILIDIPTHSYRFFPTPFLWPVSDYTFDGISWGVAWFMVLNYSAIVVTYAILFYRMGKRRRQDFFRRLAHPLKKDSYEN
jgi:hypothetical protein